MWSTVERTTFALSVLFVALILLAGEARAYGMYQDRIPNGYNVKDPADPRRSWPAIGHVTASGGPINQFGDDFNAQGRRWTIQLCRMDSDGDGASNGEELGDPDCEWRVGLEPKRTTGITHPGMKGDYPPNMSGHGNSNLRSQKAVQIKSETS